MRVLPYGDRAVLVEPADAAAVTGLCETLAAAGHAGIRSVVPAARTVLVEFDPALLTVTGLRALLDLPPAAPDRRRRAAEVLHLPVRYDGADLPAVADRTGLTSSDVARLHCAVEYTVQFCGFSPGFGYLTGLDDRLRLPRLSAPRPSVPAGSVAIADGFTGVYPRTSPGGWLLLGHTDARLFDLDREPPALLVPGTRVRFVPT